jgi:hypothetical protein
MGKERWGDTGKRNGEGRIGRSCVKREKGRPCGRRLSWRKTGECSGSG